MWRAILSFAMLWVALHASSALASAAYVEAKAVNRPDLCPMFNNGDAYCALGDIMGVDSQPERR